VRIDLVTERVQKLRAGLDRSAVRLDDRGAVQLLGGASPARGFPPFDLAVAHELC
jgi:hypothetical protein